MKKKPQAICLVPTRELAIQIFEVIKNMAKFTTLDIGLVVPQQEFPTKIQSQILVGTPGRFTDVIKKNVLPVNGIKVIVLDEADEMIEQEKGGNYNKYNPHDKRNQKNIQGGLGEQTVALIKIIQRMAKPQILLFSATFADPVRLFAERLVPKPYYNIKLEKKELTLEGIKQYFINCNSAEKRFEVLDKIYEYVTLGQSIIFVNKKDDAEQLAAAMENKGHKVAVIHGGKQPQERDSIIKDYKSSKSRVLISTNLLARGIDILTVMMVINYDLPLTEKGEPDPSTYLHRIGRSGRFGRKGIAINFVFNDKNKAQLSEISKFFGKQIDEFPQSKIPELGDIVRTSNG